MRRIALLLLLLASPALGMTTNDFNTYWIGGAINGQGRSTTIVHPRVLTTAAGLLNARDWANDAGTANKVGKDQLEIMWTTKHAPTPAVAYMPGVIANVYLDANKIGVPQYAAECSTYVGKLFDGNIECNWNTACSDGQRRSLEAPQGANYALGLYSMTANLYDLTYNEQNASRRRHAIKKLSKAICGSQDEDSGGARWQWTNYKAIPLLSIYGDSADAAFNAVIRDTLLSVINYWEARVCPCMDSLDNIGYAENYYAQRLPVRSHIVAAMKKCFPGYDSPLYHAEANANGGEFLRMMCRTDALTPQGPNQTVPMARGPDKFNTKGWSPAAMLSLQDAIYDDKDSWILANYFGLNNLCWGPTTQTSGIASSWPLLFWHDPYKYTSAIALSDISRLYEWNPTWGIFGCRSAFSATSTTNTDFQTFFYPFYIQGSGHLNAGHWQLNRGADGVFINHGLYANADLEDQYQAWLAQSISKNTIQIYQTGETSFDGTSVYVAGDKGMDATSPPCSTLPTDPYLASGYQIKGNGTEGQALFGGKCNNLAATKGQLYTRATRVQESLVQGSAYYIAEDLTKAYNAPKQDYTRRAFYTDGNGTVVILDQVQVGPNVTMVTGGYHTIDAPMNQTGTITALTLNGVPAPTATDSIRVDSNGGLFGDSRGGGYRINGNTLNETSAAAVKNVVGSSAGWMFPLEVRNASTNTNGYLLCIGGPGKGGSGAHWYTNKYPCVTNLYRSNRWEEAREFWVWDAADIGTGWNAAPSSHAVSNTCGSLPCSGGLTRFRMSANTSDWSGPERAARNNNADGHGKDTGDWSTYTVVPNPGDADLCESFVVCIGTSSTASKPTVKYTHTGEIVAVAVDQGSGYTVHVIPTASATPHATTITWDNPLTSENATVKLVGAEPLFAFDLANQSDSFIRSVTADDQGYLTWTEDTDGVTQFRLTPHQPNEPAPPPPPPIAPPYTLAHAAPYHPRERTLLRAAGGTLLALYYGQSGYGTPIMCQLSRDGGVTWRDLDGAVQSATELVLDEEASGPNFYTPRGDYGFSAALDPLTNDLWVITPAVRMNGSHTEIASLVRVKLFDWDGTTWSTSSSYTYNGAEGALAKKPSDCVALVTRSHQFFGAWCGPSGANYSIQSVRIKSGTAAAMSAGAVLASSAQYPQLCESPTNTVWLLASVKYNATEDSIRVRTATAGSSAQWGATSRVALSIAGTNGQWAACAGPTGPALVAYDPTLPGLRHAIWTGSAWSLGLLPGVAMTEPTLTAAGATRLVATGRRDDTLQQSHWSASDGWAPWTQAWDTPGLAYPHVVNTSPTRLLAFAAVTGGFAVTPIAIPSEAPPTGACCIAGFCSITTAAACGGSWQGAGTDCDPDPCPAPPAQGACCYLDGTCAVTTEAGCGGTWQGAATVCSPNPCPSGPPSASGRRRRVILAARGE